MYLFTWQKPSISMNKKLMTLCYLPQFPPSLTASPLSMIICLSETWMVKSDKVGILYLVLLWKRLSMNWSRPSFWPIIQGLLSLLIIWSQSSSSINLISGEKWESLKIKDRTWHKFIILSKEDLTICNIKPLNLWSVVSLENTFHKFKSLSPTKSSNFLMESTIHQFL